MEASIRIVELKYHVPKRFNLAIEIGGKRIDSFDWSLPYEENDFQLINWYFEDYLSEPYIAETRILRARDVLQKKGEYLFHSIFDRNEIQVQFYHLLSEFAPSEISIELEGTSKAFYEIHWESMCQQGELPLAAQGFQFLRKNRDAPPFEAKLRPWPTLNLLIVTARPGEEKDVNPHTIQRPLIEGLANTGLAVHIHILRPGTFKALIEHLDGKKAGFYHIIHFDLHGKILPYSELKRQRDEEKSLRFSAFDFSPKSYQVNWNLEDIEEYKGSKAFLFFESEVNDPGKAIPVPAAELAKKIKQFRIPVCILNACQSAKIVKSSREQSVAKALIDTGMQLVLAMSYSISVSAASIFIQYLYTFLLKGEQIEFAIAQARIALHREKNRSANLGYHIELEDWILPQVYQNRKVDFQLRAFKEEEERKFRYRNHRQNKAPKPTYGFHGRELDILKIEKLLIDPDDYTKRRPLLLRGMLGVGKSTLLKYLAWWWEESHWLEGVIFIPIGYRHYTWESLMMEMAEKILEPFSTELENFKSLDLIEKEQFLLEVFRRTPWGLILDQVNPMQSSLAEGLKTQCRDKLLNFLHALPTQMVLMFGSRHDEEWLSGSSFKNNVYQLSGLRKEGQYLLARAVLRIHELSLDTYLNDDSLRFELQELMEFAQGFPSVLEELLPLLRNMEIQSMLAKIADSSLWEELKQDKEGAYAYDLFISYSFKDETQLIEKLVQELEKANIKVWYDKFEIYVGDSIIDEINLGIKQARFGLLILSPAYFNSKWAREELKAYLTQQRVLGQKKILPVWHNINEVNLLENFPLLADIKALKIEKHTKLTELVMEIKDALYQERP